MQNAVPHDAAASPATQASAASNSLAIASSF
jgi:hypothetical protein